MIDFAFSTLKLKRLGCPTFVENIPSQKLAQSLGFRYQRLKKNAQRAKSTGKMHDARVYVLTADDWRKKRGS
jgi:RimJ/RimL family protein N-acetyltransferase